MKWYKRIRLALTLALLPALAACGAGGGVSAEEEPAGTLSAVPALEEAAPEEACVHQFAQGDNTAEHEAAGYCGNTVTAIYPESRSTGEDWKASFWGGDSVALTDLLLYLDYQEGICRCLPEYSVETEFSEEPYGVNLSSGYARHGEGQVELTEEQVELIRDILDRNLTD